MRARILKAWWPAAVWMGAIFLFSTDLFAAPETDSIVKAVLRALFPFLAERTIEWIHLALRKIAHIAVYAVLTACYARALLRTAKPADAWTPKKILWGGVLAVLYAFTDEWHQSFSSTRTATLLDVGWDALGAVLAAVGIYRTKLRS